MKRKLFEAIRNISITGVIISVILFVGINIAVFQIAQRLPNNKHLEEVEKYRKDAVEIVKTYGDSMNRLSQHQLDTVQFLEKTIHTNGVILHTLKVRTTTLENKNKVLAAVLDSVATGVPVACIPLRDACKEAVDGLVQTVVVKDSTITILRATDSSRTQQLRLVEWSNLLQTDRADSLSNIILNTPQPKKLFEFIRITPTKAFTAGVVVTTVVAILVSVIR